MPGQGWAARVEQLQLWPRQGPGVRDLERHDCPRGQPEASLGGMSFCIVSAADSRYADYLQGLLDSLKAIAAPIAVIDLGLGPADRARLEAAGVSVHQFSYPFDYPA